MISTPLSLLLDRTLPPLAGRASQPAQRAEGAEGAEATVARDFADLMSRLFYSNMPVAALVRAAEIPDTMVPPPDVERTEPEPRADAADDADRGSDTHPRDEERAAAVESGDGAAPEPAAASVSDEPPTPDGDIVPPAPAFPVLQAQSQPPAVPAAAVPPAQHAADRPLAQGMPQAAVAKETPQAAPQQARHAQPDTGTALRAQVVDGGAGDQPPSLGHMLSGRAAVVAQSDGGGAMPLKDAAAMLKSGAAEQPAAALFGGAAQSASAAQKAKGQSKSTAAAGAAQTTAGAQSALAPGAQSQNAATPVQAAAQPGFGGALAAASNGSGQPAALSPQAPRSEPLPLAGAGGPQVPQASFRAAESAAAPKPRTPLPTRFVADQVAVQIQKSLGQGNDRISIQLKPAELGKVEVRLDVGHEGRVTAVITADRADTLDLLQRDARILQHSLQDAGLRADSNSLSFELRSQGQANDHAQNGTRSNSGIAETGADDGGPISRTAPPMRPEIVTNDRVDIHV